MTERGPEFRELERRLLDLFGRGVRGPLPEEVFNELALEVFRFQCRAVPALGAFAARRGADPDRVARWEAIPFLPARAFKNTPLTTGTPSGAEAVFRTSGTTAGGGDRGTHYVRSLRLYRASLLPNFEAHLLPDGADLSLVALLPGPGQSPDSSLTFMVEEVRSRLCGGRGGFFGDLEAGLRFEALRDALAEAERGGEGVLLAGTAFSFVHWMDRAGAEGWRFQLPDGSRIMETGGFKGRSRVLSREQLYRGLQEAFGIPISRIVNEYGMTELLSQFYEPVLELGEEIPLRERYHRGPPWVRTMVLDPLTLKPVGEGDAGILAHMDLANLSSVSAILTEDVGRLVAGGFRLQGRAPGAEPRGCSLAMEDFLRGLEGGRRVL